MRGVASNAISAIEIVGPTSSTLISAKDVAANIE